MKRSTAKHRKSPRQNAGFTLLELLVVLAIGLMVTAAGTKYVIAYTDDMQNQVVADHLEAVSKAASAYSRANQGAILTTLAGSPTATVSITTLKAQGYLPPNIADTNSYRQTYSIRFVKTGPDKFEGIVVTQGGDTISSLNRRKIAQRLGAPGGALTEASATTLKGSFDNWSRPMADFAIPAGQAQLAYALFVNEAVDASQPYDVNSLSRRVVAGHPEVNQMETNLAMGGNDITAAGSINGFSVNADSATFTDLTATDINVQTVSGKSITLTETLTATGAIAGDAVTSTRAYGLASGTDLNSLVKTGFFDAVNPTNAPDGVGAYYVMNVRSSAGAENVLQMAWRSDVADRSFWRIKVANVWGPWRRELDDGVLDPSKVMMVDTDQTVVGQKTFTGQTTFVAGGAGSAAAMVQKGGATAAAIGYAAGGPTVYAGASASGDFMVGRDVTLADSPNNWLKVNSLGTTVNGALAVVGNLTVAGRQAWHAGNFNPATKSDVGHGHDASAITSGVLSVSTIPSLDASKVTTGVLADSRIPNLNASKITAGTLDDARLPARLGTFASVITDWNDATTNGIYRGTNAANGPVSGYVQAEVQASSSQSITQTAIAFTTSGSADTRTYQRQMQSGTWSAWYRLRLSEEEQATLWMSVHGGTMDGTLVISGQARSLQFKSLANTTNFMEWYADPAAPASRSAWFGYGSPGSSTMAWTNSMAGGDITLQPGVGGIARVGSQEIWHKGNFNPDSKADASHAHAAGDITSGVFAAARIPNLDASKITTGVFADARIPNLDASKITTGVFADARIPNLNASKITAGVLADARIPNLSISKITGLQDALDFKAPRVKPYFTDQFRITNGDGSWTYLNYGDASKNFIRGVDTQIDTPVTVNDSLTANSLTATGVVSGQLQHTKGYLLVGAYSSSYGSGSARIWYNATNARITMMDEANAPVGLNAGGVLVEGGSITTTGTGGWRNSSYGGGWFMQDTTWIRAFNNKSIYTAGEMRAKTLTSDGAINAGTDIDASRSITAGTTIDAGGFITGKWLRPSGVGACGGTCSPNGTLGATATGHTLSCVNGIWGGYSCSTGGGSGPGTGCDACPAGYSPYGAGCRRDTSPYNTVSCP